jgi:hypothetical protein
MKLEGLDHITMITGDAQANVDFYADTLTPVVNPRAARRQKVSA